MKKILVFLAFAFLLISFSFYKGSASNKSTEVLSSNTKSSYWFLLHRKSNVEFLYSGIPGEKDKSTLVKTFIVKTGILGQSPTPLPKLLGRGYWLITQKEESRDNPETAPYFLTLNIPVSDLDPFGPVPYNECKGQCNWIVPGYFGLHGVNDNEKKLSEEDPGSSGCIRHFDEDIIYLYNLLDPEREEIRYYIEDV
ncbi:MAG: L,D-transpeptidase [Patescibacteria group bacterium]